MQKRIAVDVDLLRKYDRPGPRYTSYPTAPYFHDGVGEQEFLSVLNQEHEGDLSLYFHIPFCDTLCWFCGCNTQIMKNDETVENYIDLLILEMDIINGHIAPGRQVAQMHWGGGTPTHLRPEQIRRLGEAIHKRFQFSENAQISVEIDPRALTKEHMEALADIGFSRCSLGVQDVNPQVQKAVNRVQSTQETLAALQWARDLGFDSVNIDLMYGLPHQDEKSFAATLDFALECNPDRLAVFSYAHLPQRIKHQKLIKDEFLPSGETKLAMLQQSIERLTEAGYEYIGMDHFAKPEDELAQALHNGSLYRNFQGYSTHAGLSMVALGASSISMLNDLYAQNTKDIKKYEESVRAGHLPIERGILLNDEDHIIRETIIEIMCRFQLNISQWEDRYDKSFSDFFAPALDELNHMVDDGLVQVGGQGIVVSEKGRLLIRNIAMCFDSRLRKSSGGVQYSRTV